MNLLIPLMVIIPIICALLLNIVHKQDKLTKIITIVVAVIVPIIPLFASFGLHNFGGHSTLNATNYLIGNVSTSISSTSLVNLHLGITYSFAQLQQILVVALGLVLFTGVITYISETRKASGAYGFLVFMAVAAASALILSDDIFHMYIFFEILALAQTGIMLASDIKNKHETALKYMIASSVAGPIMLIGIGLLLGLVGSVNITDIVTALQTGLVDKFSPILLLAFIAIFFGWLYGSGLPPFSTIKSNVYSKTMPSGAAIVQGCTVLTFVAFGIVLFRIFSHLKVYSIVIIIFSLLAMIIGLVMALMQTDFKRIIGYLAVGELGYIGLGLGIGTVASISAGLFQAVNEILITGLLFLLVSTILYQVQTGNINKLGGLIVDNPKIGLVFLISGLALAGAPPFNAYRSKLLLIQSSIAGGYPELGIIMILISIATFIAFVKIFHKVYLSPRPKQMKIINKKIPKATICVIGILLIACLILGVYPDLVLNPITQFVTGMI